MLHGEQIFTRSLCSIYILPMDAIFITIDMVFVEKHKALPTDPSHQDIPLFPCLISYLWRFSSSSRRASIQHLLRPYVSSTAFVF